VESPITARAALLQVLSTGEGYGLELIERVRVRSGGVIVLHQGGIYPALHALELQGLVDSYEASPVPERGGRPRRYYRIRPKGERLAKKLREGILGLFAD
jgi:PadR family transcriptional regulator PadR